MFYKLFLAVFLAVFFTRAHAGEFVLCAGGGLAEAEGYRSVGIVGQPFGVHIVQNSEITSLDGFVPRAYVPASNPADSDLDGDVHVKNNIRDSEGNIYGIGINPIPSDNFSSSNTGISSNVVYEALSDGFYIGRYSSTHSSSRFSQWFYLADTKANASSTSYRFYFYDRCTHTMPIAEGQFFRPTSGYHFFTGKFRVAP